MDLPTPRRLEINSQRPCWQAEAAVVRTTGLLKEEEEKREAEARACASEIGILSQNLKTAEVSVLIRRGRLPRPQHTSPTLASVAQPGSPAFTWLLT